MTSPVKDRLDKVLVDRGLAPSRERARSLILAGQVVVRDERMDKPGSTVPINAEIRIRGEDLRYVSRGGLKLEHALDHFDIDPKGVTALDVGASTGGFTDCLLQRGAAAVIAIDVGYGQIAWKLRQDPRVMLLERHNVREVHVRALPAKPNFGVVDVSFISLRLVLPKLAELLPKDSPLVALIKPQFEVGKGNVGKGGVVRDEALREATVQSLLDCARNLGFTAREAIESPILGPAGNVEYLTYLTSPGG